jgi:hypothetical protein
MLRLALLLAILLPAPAFGFERRAEEFHLTYAKAYGPWEVICGYFAIRQNASCDLRYTDIYSPRPDFRAWLIFIMNGEGENDRPGPLEFQIRMEWQSSLVGGGFTGPDGFAMGLSDCLTGGCTLDAERMGRVVEAMRRHDSLTLTFFDYGFLRREREVPTMMFEAAWNDLARQRAAHGLP